MIPTSQFEILRRPGMLQNASARFTSNALAASGTAVAVGTETVPRGLALGAHPTDEGQFALAGPSTFTGHLTRRVVVGGMSLSDRIFGVTSPIPVGVETAFTDGLDVTVEKGEEVELEGSAYILTSGVAAVLTSTPVGTQLSFRNGQVCVQQTGDTAWNTLTANNLTSTDGSSLRIRMIKN
jgi:hypothetical protein